MLKAKFYFEDLANLKIGEWTLKGFDYITVADIDEDNFTISAIFTKTDKMDLLFIKYFACPTKVEILE
jgi:hypothetical protein